MQLKEIQNKWNYQERDVKASIDMWDSMAEQFSDFEIPSATDTVYFQGWICRRKSGHNNYHHLLESLKKYKRGE